MRRLLPVVAAGLLLSAPAALAQQPRASLPDIEDEVMCTVCGTSLELSGSPQAERQRELIRGLIDRGLSKAEIKDALVAEYGSEVLAVPEESGFDLAGWLVPAAGIGVAAALLLLGLRRRLGTRDAGRPPPARAESERLERDLSRYDL